MEQDINTQAQPEATPASAGPTAAELQAQLEEVKKQSEGRLRDLQQERARRQELEARSASTAPSAANPDVTDDALAQVLKPFIAPVAKQAAEATAELENLRVEKAQNYLTSKLGKGWDAIEADKDFQGRMTQIIRKYGITGNVYDMTVRAHELMQLEDLRNKEVEKERAIKAASAQSLPSGTGRTAPTSGNKKYSADEFDRLSPLEFKGMSDSGNFRKLPDGTFEYTPR